MSISRGDYLVGSAATDYWPAPATMTKHVHRRVFAALIAAGGLFLGACSGGSGNSQDEAPNSLQQLDQAQAGEQVVARGNCAEAAIALKDAVREANEAVISPETFSLEGMKADIEMVRMAMPDELNEAFAIFAGAYTAFEAAIAGVGGVDGLSDPENAAVLAAAYETLQNGEATAAAKEIVDYFTTQCPAGAVGSEAPSAGS